MGTEKYRFIPIAALGSLSLLVLSGCGWWLPSKYAISTWIKTPEIGTRVTYSTVTTWHDGTQNVDIRTYETVDVYSSGDIDCVKFVDTAGSGLMYYLVDTKAETLYLSGDDVIGEDDYALLHTPVEERNKWDNGEGSYEITEAKKSIKSPLNPDERIDDIVEVEVNFDLETLDRVLVQWSVRYGLVKWKEEYEAGSYLYSYERELTGFSVD